MKIEKALEVVATWHHDPNNTDPSYLYEVHFWRHLTDDELIDKLKSWVGQKDNVSGECKEIKDQVTNLFDKPPLKSFEKFKRFLNNIFLKVSHRNTNSKSGNLDDTIKPCFDFFLEKLKETEIESETNRLKEFFKIIFIITARENFNNQGVLQWCKKNISALKNIITNKSLKWEEFSSEDKFKTAKEIIIIFDHFPFLIFDTAFQEQRSKYLTYIKFTTASHSEVIENAQKNIRSNLGDGASVQITESDKNTLKLIIKVYELKDDVKQKIIPMIKVETQTDDGVNLKSTTGSELINTLEALEELKEEINDLASIATSAEPQPVIAKEIVDADSPKDTSALHMFGIETSVISIKSIFVVDPYSFGLVELNNLSYHLEPTKKIRTMSLMTLNVETVVTPDSDVNSTIGPIASDLPCIARAYLLAKITLCRYRLSQLHRTSLKPI